MNISKIRTVLAVSLFAAVVGPVVACSGTDRQHGEVTALQSAPLCYAPDSPEIASGIVDESATCSCADATELVAEPDPMPDPTLADVVAEAPPMEDVPESPYSVMPAHHEKTGGSCGAGGLCKTAWTSLKKLAACLGIACAIAGGGNDTVTGAIKQLSRAVCCAKDKEHGAKSTELTNAVKAACGGDAG